MFSNHKNHDVLRKVVCKRVRAIMDQVEERNNCEDELIQNSSIRIHQEQENKLISENTEDQKICKSSNSRDDNQQQTKIQIHNMVVINPPPETFVPQDNGNDEADVANRIDKEEIDEDQLLQPTTSRSYNTDALQFDSDDSIKDPHYSPSDSDGDSTDNENDSNHDDDDNGETGNNGATTLQFDNEDKDEQTPQDEVPKKRIKRTETWKVTKRVEATLAGEKHISKSGKQIAAKSMKPGCNLCRKKCTTKIDEQTRLQIFQSYWDKQKNWDWKRQYVRSHVTTKPTNRHRPKDHSRGNQRKQTIGYNFDVKSADSVQKVDVCKLFFLNTLGISETVVRNALKKDDRGGFVSQDMRGRHVPPNKLSDAVLNGIRSHINSFPCYNSHYSRDKSTKKYLGPELNKERMYKLYVAKCEENGVPKGQVAKLWAYKKILHSEFNLGFKTPSVDTCDKCDKFVLQLKQTDEVEQTTIRQEYHDHLQDADLRYKQKKYDKEKSRSSPEKIKVIMIDLQKCLPTPYLSNNQSFYCLKLWTLNLTIYDATKKKSHCMVWDESEAGRGGHEIASALLKWAETVIANSTIETLIIWSDNCPSQNRNVMMMMNYLWLLQVCPNLKTVEHKFLLRGHTHMEADHVHGLIERCLKKQPTMEVCTPWDWQQLIRSIGATVVKMNLTDFKNFETLYAQPTSPFVNKKRNSEKEEFLISTVVHFQVQASSPGVVFYKQSFLDERFKSVAVSRSTRTQTPLPDDLPTLRKSPKGVSKKKLNFLIKLLTWVPAQFHDFYKNIPISKNLNDNADDSDN